MISGGCNSELVLSQKCAYLANRSAYNFPVRPTGTSFQHDSTSVPNLSGTGISTIYELNILLIKKQTKQKLLKWYKQDYLQLVKETPFGLIKTQLCWLAQ